MKNRAAGSAPPTPVRCAVYTRTSSDERLGQAFNSLDAQHEACAAYIVSQRSKGWALVEHYSDGGFSGKNTERPALQRLITDVQARKVDVVLTYKLDRISRSLRDFTQLAALFEQHGVACVSITQSFDTNTPMGRLTMHILLSFAEFEREVIGERIRDKLAASRQRGRWTGGTPVLGYDVDRTGPSPRLVINAIEAARVREIFALYLELGALLPVVAELERRGWRSKAWTTRDGRSRGNQAFDKGRLHALLANPLFIGRIRHKDALHAGQHEAIVDAAVFDRVQRQLRQNAVAPTAAHRNRHGALLRGLLRCGACGAAMSHTFTSRGNRRYRYFACTRRVKRGATACPTPPLPAAEIERAVVDELRRIATDRELQRETLRAAREQVDEVRKRLLAEQRDLQRVRPDDGSGHAHGPERARDAAAAHSRLAVIDAELAALVPVTSAEVTAAFADFERLWAALTPREQARMIELLVQRVTFDAAAGSLTVEFQDAGIRALAAERSAEDAA
ncbi:MAG: recombinase family protein [Phycisphaerae bacterium]